MHDNPFEARFRQDLQREMPSRANALAGAYDTALDYLQSNIYEEIRAVEPDLSDHGSRHITNVQNNIIRLLLDDNETRTPISAEEMYLLAMCTLFHDVGNVHGRYCHHLTIGDVFDRARDTRPQTRRERNLVLSACAAHTGENADGSRDTLKAVPEIDQFEGKRIRLRELAAILRFADELAEGPPTDIGLSASK